MRVSERTRVGCMNSYAHTHTGAGRHAWSMLGQCSSVARVAGPVSHATGVSEERGAVMNEPILGSIRKRGGCLLLGFGALSAWLVMVTQRSREGVVVFVVQ